jgi:uncharacterized protein YjbI with pentapeptide repeats
MANPEHIAKLKERDGVKGWNQWRQDNPFTKPDLNEAHLQGARLDGADLSEANLFHTNLNEAKLIKAQLDGANLRGANLAGADLRAAYVEKAYLVSTDLTGANLGKAHLSWATLDRALLDGAELIGADLTGADLREAHLGGANLSETDLTQANLLWADLTKADLSKAKLTRADLRGANLRGANLSGADLREAILLGTNLEEANLTGCSVYGVSVWDARLQGAKQSNLVITPYGYPIIQVDNLDVAQFIYLLLDNERIRHVIDTITSKVVLILGRFTPDRKAILDAIREELREHDYLPILFDFEKPNSKDLTGTVTTLANMARFIIADLTDPSSVPHELATIAPGTVVPVQTILLKGQREYAMFPDLMRRYHWVLEPYQYDSEETLLASLNERVIAPAEAKVIELRQK